MEQERAPTPLKCPRCDSFDTKFRYFNNNNRAQPRHYCRTCKRQWTVGGHQMNIPIGGKKRTRQTRTPSSGSGDMPLIPQPPLSSGEQLQSLQYTPPMAEIPQNFDTTMTQVVTNLPEPISPLSSYYLNHELSSFDAIQSLIEQQAMNEPVNVGHQFGSGTTDIAFMQDWNAQSATSQQVFQQQIPGHIEPYQVHGQANVEASYNLFNHNLVQPAWPMNSLPQDNVNNFNFSTTNASLWNNYNCNTPDTDAPTTSASPNFWPNFPSYGPP